MTDASYDALTPAAAPFDIQPIDRTALAEEVIDRLKELVRSDRVRPGQRLPAERELAAMLNISRPSLREALRALQYLGVVETRHGLGTYFQPRFGPLMAEPLHFMLLAGMISLLDLFQVRRVLEVGIAGVAAQRRTVTDLQNMEEGLRNQAKAVGEGDLDEYVRWDTAFHSALYAAAHSPVLEAEMDVLNLLLRESRQRTARMSPSLPHNVDMHRRVFEGVRAGDSAEAQRAMFAHLGEAEEMLRRAEE